MKGVVLAGGRGTRLLPLTLRTSKHLLPVGNKPMVVRVVDQLVRAGITELFLLIDERFASQYMEVLKDGSQLGLKSLAYIWQSPEAKGLPTAIAQVEYFMGDNKFVVVCGDVLIEGGIAQAVSDFREQDDGARMVTVKMKDTAGYSLLKVKTSKIVRILSKDKTRHKSGLIDLGVYMYSSDVFLKIRELVPSGRGETEIWDLNQIYAKSGKLRYSEIKGWWGDAGGSIKNYLEAYRHYEEK